MTARIHCNPWMLQVRRQGRTRGGDGWPGYGPVTVVEYGGMNENDSGTPVLEIHGDEAVRTLIYKLQRSLEKV